MLKFIAKKELKRIFSYSEISKFSRGNYLKTVAHNIDDNTGVNGALMADMSQPYLQPDQYAKSIFSVSRLDPKNVNFIFLLQMLYN